MSISDRLDRIDRWIQRIGLIGAFIFLPLLIFVRVFEIYTRNIINQPSSLYNAMEREVFVVFHLPHLRRSLCQRQPCEGRCAARAVLRPRQGLD